MSNFETALGAFQEALPDEGSALENQPVAPEGAPETAPVEPSQPEVPASKSIDVSGLPEEAQIFLRAREREMQADYTRKTQEIAEQRKEAENAMQFIQALNSDPTFATQVLQHLQSQLVEAGYNLGTPEDGYEVDEYGEPVGPDPYQQEIAELQNWKSQMENEWLEANLSAQLDRQLANIQSQHPDWNESDMQSIIDLGFATNGDLMAAASQYQALQDQALARYLERKSSVNTPAPLPNAPATQLGQPPRGEQELRNAAMDIIRANLD